MILEDAGSPGLSVTASNISKSPTKKSKKPKEKKKTFRPAHMEAFMKAREKRLDLEL